MNTSLDAHSINNLSNNEPREKFIKQIIFPQKYELHAFDLPW